MMQHSAISTQNLSKIKENPFTTETPSTQRKPILFILLLRVSLCLCVSVVGLEFFLTFSALRGMTIR
jgi:flagellar basal body-associated protein FliL